MTIEWTQGHDEHTWNSRIGDIYRLRVIPGVGAQSTIHYHAQVCNAVLDELACTLRLPTVEAAKREAIYLAWQHNNAIADALLSALD